MCNSLLSAVPIRGRQSNRDADMLEILQSGGNKLRQFGYLLGGIPLPRKCQLYALPCVVTFLSKGGTGGGQEAPSPARICWIRR